MTLFNDWDIEPEQEPFVCPLCKCKKYKPISTERTGEKYKLNRKASGLTMISKVKRTEILITKDFAECLNCSNRVQLSETERVLPKETKKEIADRLAETKFNKHFLNPGG